MGFQPINKKRFSELFTAMTLGYSATWKSVMSEYVKKGGNRMKPWPLIPELIKHPEYYNRERLGELTLKEDVPEEAHRMYEDYLAQTKWEKESEMDW